MITTSATGWTLHRHTTMGKLFHAAGLTLVLLAWSLTVALAHPPGTDTMNGDAPQLGPHPHPSRRPAALPPAGSPPGPLRSVEDLPEQALEITLETPRFFFHDGLFFTRIDEHYVVVPAPPGAIIPALPAGFTTLTVNGDTYYLAANVYYRPHSRGYMVVASPVDPRPHPLPPPPMPCAPAADSVTMTVHLAAGGTAPVVLKRSGQGWFGPKGEVYDRLPSEQQLAPYYR